MDIFVLIRYDCNYSQDDWHIIAVLHSKQEAILCGLKNIVADIQKPYKMRFYKERDGEFANYNGLPDYTIEQWKNNEKIGEILIGYQKSPYKHLLDKWLKENEVAHKNTEIIVESWKQSLNMTIIPDDLAKLICC